MVLSISDSDSGEYPADGLVSVVETETGGGYNSVFPHPGMGQIST